MVAKYPGLSRTGLVRACGPSITFSNLPSPLHSIPISMRNDKSSYSWGTLDRSLASRMSWQRCHCSLPWRSQLLALNRLGKTCRSVNSSSFSCCQVLDPQALPHHPEPVNSRPPRLWASDSRSLRTKAAAHTQPVVLLSSPSHGHSAAQNCLL